LYSDKADGDQVTSLIGGFKVLVQLAFDEIVFCDYYWLFNACPKFKVEGIAL
jgi:hypothetical protein